MGSPHPDHHPFLWVGKKGFPGSIQGRLLEVGDVGSAALGFLTNSSFVQPTFQKRTQKGISEGACDSCKRYVMGSMVKYTSIPWIIPNSDSILSRVDVFFHNTRTDLPSPSFFILKNVLLFTDLKLYLNSKFFSLPPRDHQAGSSE